MYNLYSVKRWKTYDSSLRVLEIFPGMIFNPHDMESQFKQTV